jgi:hypothetical protein
MGYARLILQANINLRNKQGDICCDLYHFFVERQIFSQIKSLGNETVFIRVCKYVGSENNCFVLDSSFCFPSKTVHVIFKFINETVFPT